jgi:hypothetical protein
MSKEKLTNQRTYTVLGLLATVGLCFVAAGGCEEKEQTSVSTRSRTSDTAIAAPRADGGDDTREATEAEPSKAADDGGKSDESTMPITRVEGTEGLIDLGEIPPESEHRMAFDVVNKGNRDLKIRSIRRDCECISAIKPPKVIPAGKTVRVIVKYAAPDVALPYKTRLTVVTDSSDRRFISLWVKSKSVREDG